MVAAISFVAGLGLLIGGGELLVRGSVVLARRSGVSELAIGLTVVAFGTSSPELAVSVLAAIRGSGEVAFGNVVGSNIANIGLILGVTAIIRPIDVKGSVVRREIPMMILASVALLAVSLDRPLGRGGDMLGRGDGALLVVLFGVFLYYVLYDAVRRKPKDQASLEARETTAVRLRGDSFGIAIVLVVAGLAALIGGGELLVRSAVSIARTVGVPEVVIGLTLVAVGTSLPELVTCVIAAVRGHDDLAVGNVVGSNLFNVLFVFAVAAMVAPFAVPAGGPIDVIVMVGLAVLLLPMAITDRRRITRLEGVVLVVLYAAYVGWQTLR